MELYEILREIALPARSTKNGFFETKKLDKIAELIENDENCPYKLIRKTEYSWLFGQKDLEPGQEAVLVSSHADIVDGITKPFSNHLEDDYYYEGTYDNLGTNGVCVSLMKNHSLPENVYFSFNAEEETGRCLGAADVLSYILKTTNAEPFIFALDVTDEGYEDDRLCTVEGLHAKSDAIRKQIVDIFLQTEGKEQSFEIVPLSKKDDTSFIPKKYLSEDLTVFDESVFYAKCNCNSCSICLPGDGQMHSNSGFYVKEAVMHGYEASLLAMVYAITNTHLQELKELKEKKDGFVKDAKETPFYRKKLLQTVLPSFFRNETPTRNWKTQDNDGFEYENYFGVEEEEQEGFYHPESADEYEEALQQMYCDAYEIAESYSAEEFDMFESDMLQMYGFELTPDIDATLYDIFNEVQEPSVDEDEDEEYGDYT